VEVEILLIVGCQNCGEIHILSGSPDNDGTARVVWTCPFCGTGQVLQLPVSSGGGRMELEKLVSGMPEKYRLPKPVFEEI